MSEKYSKVGEKNLVSLEKAGKFQDWMYEQLKPYLKGDVLEIGSGLGSYSKKIINDFGGNKIMLSDIDNVLIEKLRNDYQKNDNVEVSRINLEKEDDFSKIDYKFDSVLAINVLEHIDNDILAIKNIYNCLNDGGRFVVLVPAHKFLFNSIDKAIDHYRRYTKDDVRRIEAETGFKVKKYFYFNFLAMLGWYVNGNIFKKEIISESSLKLFDLLVPILRFLEKNILRKKIGISLVMILEK